MAGMPSASQKPMPARRVRELPAGDTWTLDALGIAVHVQQAVGRWGSIASAMRT